MIVARGNQKGGAGETAFALHLGAQTARQSTRIALFDAGQQGLVLLEHRIGKTQERLFAVIGLPQAALRRETPEHALRADDIIIDGQSTVVALLRSAPLASNLPLILAQSSPFDVCASAEMLRLVTEARAFHPSRIAHCVLSRRPALSLIARDVAQSLADGDPPASGSRLGQRVTFAEAARSGQLEQREQRRDSRAAPESAALIPEREQPARRPRGSATAASLRVRATRRPAAPAAATEAASKRTALLAVDDRPVLHCRTKNSAFQSGRTAEAWPA